jgi:integrase
VQHEHTSLQRCGWPKGISPSNLRHSTGFALSARDVDLGDIQTLFAHTSPATTRSFYVPGQIQRLRAATAKFDGRFGAAPFFTTSQTSTIGRLTGGNGQTQQ